MADNPFERYNPKTNEVATYNPDAKQWSVVSLDTLTPDQKYETVKDSPDGTFKAGLNKYTKKWERIENEDWIDKLPVPSSVERGIRKASLIDDYLGLESGIKKPEDVSKEVARVSRKIQEEPMSDKQKKGLDEIYSSKTFPEFVTNVVKNPSTVGSIFGESLGSMSGTALASIGLAGVGKLAKASPWAARMLQAGTFGVGSGVTEATNTFFDGLSDHGVDITNHEAVSTALKDPALVDKLNTKAILRGVPIGLFDGITAGIAGKTMEAFEGAGKTAGNILKGSLAETGIQAAGGAAGEATAQLASEGKITSPVDVGLEAIMEGITGAPEALYMTIATRPNSSLELKMPGFSSPFGMNKDGTPTSPELEVIGQVEEKVKAKRKAKAKKVDPIADEAIASDLKAFEPLVNSVPDDNIQPEAKSEVVPKAQVAKEQAVPKVTYTLPDELKKSRTNFGTKPVNFSSDIDKALYIVSGNRKSKSHSKFNDWLKNTVGMSQPEIDTKASEIRNKVKKAGLKLPKEDTSTINIGDEKPKSKSKVDTKPKRGFARLYRDPTNPNKLTTEPTKSDLSIDLPITHPVFENFSKNTETGKVEYDATPDLQIPISQQKDLNVDDNSEIPNTNYDLAVENLRGIDIKDASPELLKTMDDITKHLKRILGDKVAIKFYDTLKEIRSSTVSNPIRGVQWLNNIAIATNLSNNRVNPDMFETGLHEAFHYAQDNLLNMNDKALLQSQSQRIKRYVQKMTGISSDDILGMYKSEEGQREIEATAFGIYAANKLRDNSYSPDFLSPQLENIFKKVLNFLKEIAKFFNGQSFTDIFDDVIDGRRVDDILQEGIEFNRGMRWQKITQAIQEDHQDKTTQDSIKFAGELRKAIRTDEDNLSPLGFYGKYLASMTHLASKSRVFSFIYNTERTRQEITNKYYAKHDDYLKSNGLKGLERRYMDGLHNVMDECRNSSQKANLDSEGYLTFKRDGKLIRVKDKEFSAKYVALQGYYSMILDDLMLTLKGKIAKKFGFNDMNFSKEDVLKALNESNSETKKAYYNNILETLDSFEKLKRRDYVPHQRFGPFGFSVRDKTTGKLIDFSSVEAASTFDTANKFYSKKQLQETLDRFRNEYSDTSKYVIYGKDGKKITNLSSLEGFQPFELTTKNIADHISNSAVSFDLLFSMMQSRGMDEKILNDMHESLIKNFLSTGFAKHLTESDNIKGYSTDWTRVQHSYGAGAAHYIGNIHVDDRMQAIREVIKEGKFSDLGLKEAASKYADYIMSPAEDYMKMRMFNFTWTMGGNLSTAMLQVVTLPTMTLGNITKFNTNIFANIAALNKWWWLGTKFIGNSKQLDGTLVIDFGKGDILKGLKESGVANQKMLDLLKYASEGSLTGGVSVREYAGSRKYDIDSVGGRIHDKMTIFSNLLGLPMSFMEQMTRFASLGALYEQYAKVPDIEAKIMEAYKDDQRFLEQLKTRSDLDIVQNAALYALDEAHAVFGKVGRAPFQRGLGGSLFFPFQTYPQNAIESMARMYGQGKAGKAALGTTLGTLFVFAGLLGLPGAELLKELLEGIYEKFAGETVDFDYLTRERIYNATGSADLGSTITKGVPRFLGLDVSSRIGMQVPGQDVLLSVLGMRGDTSNMLGVQGSLLSQIGDAWNRYSTDASLSSAMSALTPTAIANIFKAVEYANEGVYTNKNVQLIAPNDVSPSTIALRAMGIASSQTATYREQNFYSKILEKQYAPFIEKNREIAKKHLTRYYRLLDEGEVSDAKEEYEKYNDTLKHVLEVAKEKNFPINMASFKRSVLKASMQRKDPQQQFKRNLNKTGKQEADNLNRVLGIIE